MGYKPPYEIVKAVYWFIYEYKIPEKPSL